MTNESEVFVTATSLTGGQAIVVAERKEGEGFTVILENPVDHNVTFSWFIIN